MRIVGGSLRGRRLHVPAGTQTRPTSDRAREALFNILMHGERPLDGASFLDVFAGSGAVGIEAASRGARNVLLIENDRLAIEAIRRNIDTFAIGDTVKLQTGDATRLPTCFEAFDFAFVDPPYGSGSLVPALGKLAANAWLRPGARVICETSADANIDWPRGFDLNDSRRYGAAVFHFLYANP